MRWSCSLYGRGVLVVQPRPLAWLPTEVRLAAYLGPKANIRDVPSCSGHLLQGFLERPTFRISSAFIPRNPTVSLADEMALPVMPIRATTLPTTILL